MVESDFIFILLGAAAFFGSLLAAYLVARRLGFDAAALLEKREWRLTWQICGIIVMALVLYLTNIVAEFPAEMFIYGRF